MALAFATVTTDLGGYGLTWLVQSSALLGLGMLVGSLLKRFGPAVQSGVYRTTLGAVLICPVASALLAGAGFEGLTLRLSSPADADAVPAPITIAEPPSVQNPAIVGDPSSVSQSKTTQQVPTPPSEPSVAASPPTPPLASPAPVPKDADGLDLLAGAAGLVLATWLLGSAALGLRLLLGEWRMRRLRASAVAADQEVVALCRHIAERMSVSAPGVLRSPFLFSPCLDGLRRPVILLPDDVGDNLRETFVHELAHLVRHDGVWNLLRRVATAAFWVQPLLWELSRRIEATAEEVCDDYVVQFGADRARYAGHLLELAGRALPPTAAAGVGMVSLRSMLARRIVRILDSSRLLSTRAGTRAVVAMVVVGMTGTLLAGLVGVGGGERKAEARTELNAGDAGQTADDTTVRGQVVDPTGKPYAGARVIAFRSKPMANPSGDDFTAERKQEVLRTTTGEDGRFEVEFKSQPDPQDPQAGQFVRVIAMAPGFGLGYYLKGQPIHLTPGDVPITGRLVDLEGRPVAGAKIRPEQAFLPPPEMVGGAVSQAKLGATRQPQAAMKTKSVATNTSAEKIGSMVGRLIVDAQPLFPDGVVTDADGKFQVAGLGRDVLASLTVSGPTIAFKRIKVLTRSMNRVADESRDPEFAGLDEPATYGASARSRSSRHGRSRGLFAMPTRGSRSLARS